MNRKFTLITYGISLLFAAGVFFFFGFPYMYHLHYQEQCQLFQWTWAYFREVCSVPGGFADWCGRFIVQFFYYSRAGAGLLALLFFALQRLSFRAAGRKDWTGFALSFIPAVMLMVFYLDENAILGAVVSVLLCVAAALFCGLFKEGRVRTVLCLAGVPVMYFLCGPLSLIYLILACRGEKLRTWFSAAALLALCIFLSQFAFAYPLERLLRGIHYHRYPSVIPIWIWLAALSYVLIALWSCLKLKAGGQGERIFEIAATASVVCFFCALLPSNADFDKEDLLEYDFMVQHHMWNRMMMKADKTNPETPMSVSCLNIALAESGRMNNNMFDYYQNGPDGLLPPFVRDCTSPLPTAEIYWLLGMVNTAQRFVFEAEEAIPDFQKSGRCHKFLVKTNIVNRDYDVARKYNDVLMNTLFYRDWAKENAVIFADTSAVASFPEYVAERGLRLREHDFLFSDTEMDSMLGLLTVENRRNALAYDYLMAWVMLSKDLPRFLQCYSLTYFAIPPRHYQEAFLLAWTMSHPDFNGLPVNINVGLARSLGNFISDYNSGKSDEYMRFKYGNTYWYYYYFRNNQ